MITNDLKNIVLLNPVKINYSLAKWNRNRNTSSKNDGVDSDDSDIDMAMTGGSFFGNGRDNFPANANVWDGVPFAVRREFRSPAWRVLVDAYIRFRLLFQKPNKDSVEFFMEVKDNFESWLNPAMGVIKAMVEL